MSFEAAPTDQPVSLDDFRNAMSRLASGVVLVTSVLEGQYFGLVATSVCSVSIAPPTLLVAINRMTSTHTAIEGSARLCVNIIGETHRELVDIFCQPERRSERFDERAWSRGATGAPILKDALVSFDCRMVRAVAHSTHTIFFCEPVNIDQLAEARRPLVHFARGFRELP